ncbi:MAG: hypothetical protein WBE18_01130 [Gammaproteobacteria bacterium]
MNKSSKPYSVAECKIQASILLKSFHSNDPEKAKSAAKRLRRLPEFDKLSLEEIIQTNIKRKHALAVIALEKGFKSWADLKCQIPFIIGGFLNKWFVNYEEAKTHLHITHGFLLPYKNQFFICEADYIKQIGLDPNDPDWELMGYDWAKPSNHEAWQRLYKKWMEIQGGKS